MELLVSVKTERQLKKLKKFFPNVEIPEDSSAIDGFYIPSWKSISSKTYQDAVLIVCKKIQKEFGVVFSNNYKNVKGEYLKTVNPIAENGGVIKDITVSKNSRTATEVASDDERYALGLYELLIILLTNYESFVHKELFIICPGDLMCSILGGEFNHVPIVKISRTEILLLSHEKCQKFSFSFATGRKH